MTARAKWIELHNYDPTSRLRSHNILPTTDVVSRREERDTLEAPEEEFVELSVWQQEHKHLMPEGSKELPTPEMVGLKRVQE